MAEIWNAIQDVNSFQELWEWYKIQSIGMKVFLGFVAFGFVYAALKLITALVPWE